MFKDFEQGAYNSHEHDFTERSDEQLKDRLDQLFENRKQPACAGERLERVMREMTLISFEIAQRTQQPIGYTEQEKEIITRLGGKL